MVSEKDNNLGREKVIFCLVAVLFSMAPFHAFLMTWFRHLGLDGIPNTLVSAWREIILFFLLLSAYPEIEHFFRKAGKSDFWDFVRKNYFSLIFFFGIPFMFVIFGNALPKDDGNPLAQWLWGARYDLLPFFILLLFQFLIFSKEQIQKLLKIILGVGFFVTVFGLIHALFLPQDFLTFFGYSINRNIWDPTMAISSCQFLEHTQNFCRATSFFGGPTRYGTYLLLILSLSVMSFSETKEKKRKIFLGLLIVLSLTNILLTYSRSIWVGFLALVVASLILLGRERIKPLPWGKILATIIALFAVFIFFTYDSLQTILFRASSTSEHWQLMKEGWRQFLQHPFGLGLGTVGPASVYFKKFITENWYIQIALETGVLGILLFLAALFQIFKNLLEKIREGGFSSLSTALFLTLLGISVAGLFTHSFEETTTVILLFGLIGLSAKPLRE